MAGCAEEPALGTLRLGLGPASADQCEAYCVESYSVQVRHADGLQPVKVPWTEPIDCQDELIIEGLPAGAEFVAEAVLTQFSSHWWGGQGEVVTILAGQTTELSIPLDSLAPPVITALEPDPLVFAGEGSLEITIEGQLFRGGSGDSGVTVGGSDLAVTEWRDHLLTVDIPSGTPGGDVVVTSCGAWSATAPLRILAPEIGTLSSLQPCSSAAMSAVTPSATDGWIVGWRCDDTGDGRLLELSAGCTLDRAGQLTVDTAPVAIAAAPDGASVWLALPDSTLSHVSLTTGDTLADGIPAGGSVLPGGLAFGGQTLFALVEQGGLGVLHRLAEGGTALELLEDVPPGRDVVAIAAGDGRVYMAMAEGDNGHIGWASEAGDVEDEYLAACGQPTSVAVSDGAWAVLGCDTGGVAGYATETGEDVWIPLAAAPTAVALDRVGDIAFAWVDGELVALSLPAEAELVRWPLAVAAETLSAAPGVDLLLLGGSDLGAPTLVTPYDTATPCSGAGE